jgi:two-component system sensor histidine kinase PilS (NtrC family)
MNNEDRSLPGQMGIGSWPGAIGVMAIRLLLLSGLMALLAFILPHDNAAFFALMAIAYVVSIPYALWLRNRERIARLMPLQFLVDLVLVTGVVYFTGGVDSNLSLLYPLIILSAGMVTSPLRAAQVTVLCILAYVTMVLLMQQGVLLPYGNPMRYSDWPSLGRALLMNVFIFACFGAAGIYVSKRCNFADKRINRFREMAELIFRKVGAGLILFDEECVILMANEHACKALDLEEATLVGSHLKDYMAADWVYESVQGAEDVSQCYFKRSDGSTFPVSFEIATVSLPAETIPGYEGKGIVEAVIIAFSDISPILEMQQQIKNAERVQAANHMAAEIAHEIRNPLAAISGSVQVLQRLERRAFLGDAKSAEILLKEKNSTYDRIVAESSRLDTTIERFIDFTEFSPEAFAKLQEYLTEVDFSKTKPGK